MIKKLFSNKTKGSLNICMHDNKLCEEKYNRRARSKRWIDSNGWRVQHWSSRIWTDPVGRKSVRTELNLTTLSKSWMSVQFSQPVLSDSLQPHGLQHARPPCLSPTPRACSNSSPLSWWCHATISSSVVPFSSHR